MDARRKRLISILLAAILILAIPFLIYLGVSLNLIFDRGFYLLGFEKNRVYDNFEDRLIPRNVSEQLVSYFWSDSRQPPEIGLFNPAEKSHLLDVKNIILSLKSTTYLLVALLLTLKVLSLIFFRKIFLKNLGIITLMSGALSLLFGLLLLVLALNFEWAFINFHHLLFPQGNWMFPSNSSLIMLFPGQTFQDFFTTILLRGFIISLLLTLLGIVLLLFRKKYKRKNK
jgi:integral membrane protein (TIGR01906 family)